MKLLAATLSVWLLALATACAGHEEPARVQRTAPSERTLVGQVVLPSGVGSRGVEVTVMVAAADSEPHREWVLFDEQGRFTHALRGNLTRVTLAAGGGAEVHRIDTEGLPELNQAGQIDVGVIDLRDRLMRHRMTLRAAAGKPAGEVRVAMWFGPPPVGPSGEPVALGSAQFPPVALGSEVEWLVSPEAQSMYFLVERPDGPDRGTKWRSGHQRLFGPYDAANLPTELIMD